DRLAVLPVDGLRRFHLLHFRLFSLGLFGRGLLRRGLGNVFGGGFRSLGRLADFLLFRSLARLGLLGNGFGRFFFLLGAGRFLRGGFRRFGDFLGVFWHNRAVNGD